MLKIYDQDDDSELREIRSNILETRNLLKDCEILYYLNSPLFTKLHGICMNYKYKNIETVVIVLEYCQNGSLTNYLKQERKYSGIFNDTLKLNCIYGIAFGMSYLHSHKIIHRNLNQKKILFDDKFIPKINDFSSSYYNEEIFQLTMTNEIGSLSYMAPEMLTNNYSYPVDVYSFGILLHEILTGELPYEGGFLEFHDFLKSGQSIEFSEKVPKCYQGLISKCLSYEPSQRPTFPEIVNLLKRESFLLESANKNEFIIFCNYIEAPNSDESISPSVVEITRSEGIQKLDVDAEPIDLSLFEKEELIGKGSFGKVYRVVTDRTADMLPRSAFWT